MILCGMNQHAVLSSVIYVYAEKQLGALQSSPHHAHVHYMLLNQILIFYIYF